MCNMSEVLYARFLRLHIYMYTTIRRYTEKMLRVIWYWWAFLRISCALYSAPSFSLGSWTFGLVGHSWVRIYKTNTGIFLISNQLDYILHVNIYIYIYIAYVIGQTAHSCPNCVLNDKTDYLPIVVQKPKKIVKLLRKCGKWQKSNFIKGDNNVLETFERSLNG